MTTHYGFEHAVVLKVHPSLLFKYRKKGGKKNEKANESTLFMQFTQPAVAEVNG